MRIADVADMNNKRLPMPDSLKIPNSLIPIVDIAAADLHFELKINNYEPPTNLVPPRQWLRKLEATRDAIKKAPIWEDFEKAYDYVRNDAYAFPAYDDKNLLSDVSSLVKENRFQVTSLAIYNTSTMRMFINTALNADTDIIESDWFYFLDAYDNYESSPQDFFSSYEFVNAHPMFWRIHGDLNSNSSIAWDTLNGFDSAHHTVFRGRDAGDIVHQLEGGPASCEPRRYDSDVDYRFCTPKRVSSLDTDITASGDTYELAVVAFANKIYRSYSLESASDWVTGCSGH